MTPRRLYFGFVGLMILLVIGLVAGTYGANKMLTARANRLTNLKVKTLALEQESLNLAQAKKEIAKNTPLAQIAQTVVPQDKDQAETVREIVKIAAANNVTLASITFPASTLGGTAAGTTAPTTTNSKSSALSQLQPVKNIAGVYVLQIKVQSDTKNGVSYEQFIGFLSALEQNRRTAEVSAITLQPSPTNPSSIIFSLTLNEYIRP